MAVVDWTRAAPAPKPTVGKQTVGAAPLGEVVVPVTTPAPRRLRLNLTPGMQTGLINWAPWAAILVWPIVVCYFYANGFSLGAVGQDFKDHVWPSSANALGHDFREPLLGSLATAGEKTRMLIRAGASLQDIQLAYKANFMAERDAQWTAKVTAALEAIAPDPAPPASGQPATPVVLTAEQAQKLNTFFADFDRGLTRKLP